MNFRNLAAAALLVVPFAAPGSAQTTSSGQTSLPRPAPFPAATQTATPKPGETVSRPPASPLDLGSIDPKLAGVQGYPGAEFLESYDAGKGQRMFAFGTNDPFATVLAFYKNQFKRSGEEVSRTPAIVQFDLGPFDVNTMAQRPSVVVKDFTWPDPAGYLHVAGTTQKHFKTIVHIIPVAK